MLDDKDEFVKIGYSSYLDGAVEMVNHWWIERGQRDISSSENITKGVAAGYIKKWLEHFAPCLDLELKQRNLVPYSCTEPKNWKVCSTHVHWRNKP